MILDIHLSEKMISRWPEHMEGLVKIDRRNYRIAPNHRGYIQEFLIRSHCTDVQKPFLKSYLWTAEFHSDCRRRWELSGEYAIIDSVVIRFHNLTQRQATVISLVF